MRVDDIVKPQATCDAHRTDFPGCRSPPMMSPMNQTIPLLDALMQPADRVELGISVPIEGFTCMP